MKVIVTAGGTGGHVYPALAIIDKIKELEPDSKFLFIGTKERMESKLVPSLGIDYIGIEMNGLSKNIVKLAKTGYLTIKNTSYCKKLIKEFKPDAVIGIGGYVTYPVIRAAKALKVKTFIHEQNSIPGKTNVMLARLADKIGISFEESKKYFDEKKCVFTGNPCSERALKIDKIPKEKYGIKENRKFVIMTQGSLGSTSVNEKMKEFLSSIDDEKYDVLYITGKSSYEEFSKNKFSKNVHITSYVENLAGLMKEADAIVSRAGASTISEIIALEKLSILIPSPYVANNHQFFNALSITNNRAALMIEEKNLNKDNLKKALNDILFDKQTIINMKINLKKLQKNDSSTIIYNTIKEMIK